MPVDLSVVNPVWADLLPSSNYTPAVKWQCSMLHNPIQFQNRSFYLTKFKLLWAGHSFTLVKVKGYNGQLTTGI